MIKIYTDGGLNSDKKMCAGLYVLSDEKIFKHSEIYSEGTSHSAEEQAVLMAIKFLQNYNITESTTIYTDFISIVKIVNNKTAPSSKIIKNFPNITFIRDYIKENNITIKWISGKDNPAHSVISDSYEGIIYKDLDSFRINNPLESTNSKDIITDNNTELLNFKLKQKDIIIKDLTNIINKIMMDL